MSGNNKGEDGGKDQVPRGFSSPVKEQIECHLNVSHFLPQFKFLPPSIS